MRLPIRVRRIAKWLGLTAAVLTFMAWLISLTMLPYGDARSFYKRRFAHVYVTNGGIVVFICNSKEPWADSISLHDHPWRKAGFILPALTTRNAYGISSAFVGLSTWERDSEAERSPIGVQKLAPVGTLHTFFLPFWVPLILFLVPTCILWWLDVPFRGRGCTVCQSDIRHDMNGVCPACVTVNGPARNQRPGDSPVDSSSDHG